MVRTQILLREREYELLKMRARRECKSLSEVVREAVDALLGGKPPARRNQARLDDLFGLSDRSADDSALNHDKYLYRKP